MEMRWEITRSSADTEGELFEATNWLDAGMAGPPLHVHPTAEDRFEVLEGTLEFCVDGQWRTLRPGESAAAPAGSHTRCARRTANPSVRSTPTGRRCSSSRSFATCTD